MRISIITLFPKMISGFFEESIVKRAIEKKLIEIELINLRDFAVDDYGSVDDRPYGGGAGMILRADVIYKALAQISNFKFLISKQNPKSQFPNSKQASKPNNQYLNQRIILTSPRGKLFNQQKAKEYSRLNHLVIIAGHYEGVDERVLDFVDEEISLGDFVLTGGEIVAAAITDAVVRLIPGVLKKTEATKLESFNVQSINRLYTMIGKDRYLDKLREKGIKKVKLLEYPQYTRPENFMGKKVPKILLSGNHKEIEKWRMKKALGETLKRRKNLIIQEKT